MPRLPLILALVLLVTCACLFACALVPNRESFFFFASASRCPEGQPHESMTDDEITDMYRLIQIVAAKLDEHGVRWFVTCGTLLGAVRHGGLIPWDDDADIGVVIDGDADREAFERACDELRDGLGVDSEPFGDNAEHNFCFRGRFYPFIDVFFVSAATRKGGGGYAYRKANNRRAWPKERFAAGELLPLKRVRFGELSVPAPNVFCARAMTRLTATAEVASS